MAFAADWLVPAFFEGTEKRNRRIEVYHRHLRGYFPCGGIWSRVLAVHSRECGVTKPRFGASCDTAFRTDDCFRGIRDDHFVVCGSRGLKDPRLIGGGGIGVNHNRAGTRPSVS